MRLFPTSALLAAGVWLGLRRHVANIKQNPDPYPYSQLRQEPQGETVIIARSDGGSVRAVVAGEGPPVVLSHGYGVTLLEWNVVMPMLVEKGYRVIAFDQLGHGRSKIGRNGLNTHEMAACYKSVLEHFNVQDGVLVGHSTGGYLSIATLLTWPALSDRLKGLVLFASTAGDVSKGAPQNKVQIPLIKAGIMTAIAKTDLLGLPFGASLYGDAPSPAAARVFKEVFAAQDHASLLPILRDLDATSFYHRLGEITLPAVVVCGEKDGTTPPWHSQSLGRDIPNARNVWVPNCGHMLNWEAPDALVSVVDELHRVKQS